jgi:hypothetical protein
MNANGSAADALSLDLLADLSAPVFAVAWVGPLALDFEAAGGAVGPSARTTVGTTHDAIAIVTHATRRKLLITASLFPQGVPKHYHSPVASAERPATRSRFCAGNCP